jgi:hypothetical protein
MNPSSCAVFCFPRAGRGVFFVVLRRVPGQSIRAACIAVVVAVHDGDLGEGWVADMLFRLGLSSEQRS